MSGSISATTLAYAAVAAAAIGGGVSAYAQVSSAGAQKDAQDYNAKVASNNALDAEQRGAQAAADHKQKVRELIATQTAAAGASGVDTASGTAGQIATETAGTGELDALRMINNAQRQASGLQAQSTLDEYQGNAAATAGSLNAAGTLIGGLGRAGGQFATYQNGSASPGNTAGGIR